jgi:hypothetical protein
MGDRLSTGAVTRVREQQTWQVVSKHLHTVGIEGYGPVPPSKPYSSSPAASRAWSLALKYWTLTIFPSRQVST